MRTWAPGSLLALGAALAGCGATPSSAGDFEGDQKAVADAIEEIQSAAQRREADRLCRDLLSRRLRDGIAAGGTSCDSEVGKATEDADAYELEVQKVNVTGTTASATVKGEAGDRDVTRTVRLVKEDGRWRVDAF